jgi:hypothetical protein
MPATKTAARIPGFRPRWTDGAYGYAEADTFAAAKAGFKRARRSKMFHMTNTGEAGKVNCVTCGMPLAGPYPVNVGTSLLTTKTDEHSTWNYDPARKAVVGGQHYGCSWSTLLTAIANLREM